jgi:hypothetical protein
MFALGDGRDGTGEALITFALGDAQMSPERAPDGKTFYPVHFHVVAWDRTTSRTVTLDTTRRFLRDQPLQPGDRFAGWLEMALPGGDWQIAVRATQESDSSGAYALTRDVHVDSGTVLAVSDAVFGLTGSTRWRATDGGDFPINALGAWQSDSRVELYYEVHGVAANGPYNTSITLRPADAKSKDLVRIATTDRSQGSVTRVRRSMVLPHLKAGSYEVTITIDAGTQHATRKELLIVLALH